MAKKTDKQIFDVWAEGAENWSRAQQAWLDSLDSKSEKKQESSQSFFGDNPFVMNNPFTTNNPFSTVNPFIGNQNTAFNDFIKQSGTDWEQYTTQYDDWLSAAKQWFPSSMSGSSDSSADEADRKDYFAALKMALDPSTFMQMGSNDLTKAFQKLLNAPQFADFGTFENRMMQMMNDSSELRKASAEYQSLISASWSKAFGDFMAQASELFKKPFDDSENGSQSVKDMIDQWLKIANKKLLDTQRSPEFLDAQKQLFKAATQCKDQQNEMIEQWCEYVGIPSRAEVDDLHKKVHELKREVRKLKNQSTASSSGAKKALKAAAPKTAASKTTKPSTTKTPKKVTKTTAKKAVKKTKKKTTKK